MNNETPTQTILDGLIDRINAYAKDHPVGNDELYDFDVLDIEYQYFITFRQLLSAGLTNFIHTYCQLDKKGIFK